MRPHGWTQARYIRFLTQVRRHCAPSACATACFLLLPRCLPQVVPPVRAYARFRWFANLRKTMKNTDLKRFLLLLKLVMSLPDAGLQTCAPSACARMGGHKRGIFVFDAGQKTLRSQRVRPHGWTQERIYFYAGRSPRAPRACAITGGLFLGIWPTMFPCMRA